MNFPALLLTFGLAAAAGSSINRLHSPDAPNPCEDCVAWNRKHPPLHIFGNTWWVGVEGLSVIAISTDAGIILLDGALSQSVPRVKANLSAVGFRLADVKLIGNSHVHFDHAGGISALQRDSGATVIASPSPTSQNGQ